MGRTLIYPKTAGTTINRYKDRGTYDLGAIHRIVQTSSVLHVSFVPSAEDPFPAILPMIGVLGSFTHPSASLDEPLDLYLHGYVSSRVMNMARSSRQSDALEGMPISVAATLVDGLVLSLTPNSHSYNYRSAVLHGYATVVTEMEEKLFAMRLVTNKVMADRWENSRNPPDGAEMSSTSILRVKVVAGSGKIRQGLPHDDAKDTSKEELTSKIWTGVIPVHETLGQPVKGGAGTLVELPQYLQTALEERRKDAAESAIEACNEP